MTNINAPAGGFAGPVKRSITIAGHATSISLEPMFWQALERAAVRRALPLSALVAQVDAFLFGQRSLPPLNWKTSIFSENAKLNRINHRARRLERQDSGAENDVFAKKTSVFRRQSGKI